MEGSKEQINKQICLKIKLVIRKHVGLVVIRSECGSAIYQMIW